MEFFKQLCSSGDAAPRTRLLLLRNTMVPKGHRGDPKERPLALSLGTVDPGKNACSGAVWLLGLGDSPKREMMGICPARGKKRVSIPIEGNPDKICKLELGFSPVSSQKYSGSELPTGTNSLPFPNHVRK